MTAENNQNEVQAGGIEKLIASELSVTPRQVWAAIKLLDEGATVPFIARYRKEATGGLTDDHLRMLAERLDYLRELEKRRGEIIQSIAEQGKLSDSLKKAIDGAQTKAQLEDLYLPFRPKKRSKAQTARESGLEPLAKLLLEDPKLSPDVAAKDFVNADKNVPDVITALSGAREILMEIFSENATLIGSLRQKYWDHGFIVSQAAKEKPETEDMKFSDYFNFREPIRQIPSHRMLALLRGRQEGALRANLDVAVVEPDVTSMDVKSVEDEYIQAIAGAFKIEIKGRPADNWLYETAKQSWKYKIRIHLELDIMMMLRKNAEEEAIKVFAQNLKSLLLAAPAGARATLGLDPGFRTGVKASAIDKTGKVLAVATLYPHPPEQDADKAKRILTEMIRRFSVELIAIGNGTASRETDAFVQKTLKENPELKVQKVIVSEAGASVYSASERGSKELPSLDVSLRGAVSIARRLQDPLAELVKIDPKSIGVGQYQHDVNQTRLEQMLHHVVEDCVNAVGVEANTASVALLSYVSGLNKTTAASIVEYREKNGSFKNRTEFMKVAGLGAKSFEQAAGFMRINAGENPLDASGVHPEAYPVVEKIIAKTKKDIKEIIGNREFVKALKPADFSDEKFGIPTVTDILAELEKPGRDPRPEFRTATLKDDVCTMDDLKPGMTLEGTVTNVANFGAFVDIGVHQDGLVHISELADKYVSDPHAVVKTGQIVKVRVMDVDKLRKRIALSMKSPSSDNVGGAFGKSGLSKAGASRSAAPKAPEKQVFNSAFKNL